jgi:hypothetical protein
VFPPIRSAFRAGGDPRRLPLAVLSVLLASIVVSTSAAAFPATAADSTLGGDERWGNEFPPPGVSPFPGDLWASVDDAVCWRDRIVIQGDFGFVEGIPAAGVATESADGWEPLGTWPVADHLRVAGGRLFALSDYPWVEDGMIQEWRGEAWVPIGQGLTAGLRNTVRSVALLDGAPVLSGRYDSYGGDGSHRSRAFVFRLTENGWADLGSTPFPDSEATMDLKVLDGVLYAYGTFTIASEDTARNLARWTGSRWEPVGAGFNYSVLDLALYHGRLVAAGWFTRSGSVSTPGIAILGGEGWKALGGGMHDGTYRGVVQSVVAAGDSLLAVGTFDHAGNEPIQDVAFWDGSAWHGTLDSGESVACLDSVVPVRAHGDWFLSGKLDDESGRRYSGLFRLKNDHWTPYRQRRIRLVSPPTALAADERGLLVAGQFLTPDSLGVVHGICVWNGTALRVLAEVNGDVNTVDRYQGRLVVGGEFDEIGGNRAGNIAMFYQGTWTSMGGGTDGEVSALQNHDGALYVGGNFTRAGGVHAMNIARWNGAEWTPVGSGANATTFHILDLEVYGGDLYACGFFNWMGQDHISLIARWDGRSWSAVGEPGALGDFGVTFRMAVWRGRLAVTGRFHPDEHHESYEIHLWDGTRWVAMSRPVDYPYVVLSMGANLFVGGRQDSWDKQGLDASCVWASDGSRWLGLGHGIWSGTTDGEAGPEISTMASWGGDLYVGGRLMTAGDHPAAYVACWHADGLNRPTFRTRLAAGPNPSTGPVTVTADVRDPGPGRLRVLDVRGREVARLAEGYLPGGERTWTWNLRDSAGRRVAPGVYFLRLDTTQGAASGRLVVLP